MVYLVFPAKKHISRVGSGLYRGIVNSLVLWALIVQRTKLFGAYVVFFSFELDPTRGTIVYLRSLK